MSEHKITTPPAPSDRYFLTPKETCDALRISTRTLLRWKRLWERGCRYGPQPVYLGPEGRRRAIVRYRSDEVYNRRTGDRWLDRFRKKLYDDIEAEIAEGAGGTL